MGTAIVETVHQAEFLLSEANGTLSREKITLVSGTPLVRAGHVLGLITASGKYDEYDEGNVDGSEVARVVLLTDVVDASAADADGVGIVRLAEVNESKLTFKAAVDEAAGKADLLAQSIIQVRGA